MQRIWFSNDSIMYEFHGVGLYSLGAGRAMYSFSWAIVRMSRCLWDELCEVGFMQARFVTQVFQDP